MDNNIQNNDSIVSSEQVINTPIDNNEVINNNKKNNKLVILIVSIIIIIVIGVVFFLFIKSNYNDMNNSKSVLKSYINSIVKKEYDSAFKYVYKTEVNFINKNDFISYINNDNLLNGKIKNINELSKDDNSVSYEVEMSDKKYKYNLKKDYNDEWGIVLDDFYILDWKVEVPSKSKLYIDNVLLDNSFVKESKDNHDVYVIPEIGMSNNKFRVESLFGVIEKDINVSSDNSGSYLCPSIDDDTLRDILFEIKRIWNRMYLDYTEDAGVSNVRVNYFDDKFSIDDIKKYYIDGFNKMTNSSNKTSHNTELEMDTIIKNDKKDSVIISNDVIEINFGYKIKFKNDFVSEEKLDTREYMTRYSNIKLKKNNSGYVIYEVSDEGLFNYLKKETKEFR